MCLGSGHVGLQRRQRGIGPVQLRLQGRKLPPAFPKIGLTCGKLRFEISNPCVQSLDFNPTISKLAVTVSKQAVTISKLAVTVAQSRRTRRNLSAQTRDLALHLLSLARRRQEGRPPVTPGKTRFKRIRILSRRTRQREGAGRHAQRSRIQLGEPLQAKFRLLLPSRNRARHGQGVHNFAARCRRGLSDQSRAGVLVRDGSAQGDASVRFDRRQVAGIRQIGQPINRPQRTVGRVRGVEITRLFGLVIDNARKGDMPPIHINIDISGIFGINRTHDALRDILLNCLRFEPER